MKSLILLTLLSLMLIVSMPVSAQVSTKDSTVQVTQTDPPAVVQPAPAAKVGFFEKIWNNAKDSGIWVVIMYVAGILSKNGITKVIKAIAGKGTIITKELSDVALASSQFFKLLDSAIKDDGTVVQDSLKQAVDAGKTVIAETKESWITIKPKPVVEIPAG